MKKAENFLLAEEIFLPIALFIKYVF